MSEHEYSEGAYNHEQAMKQGIDLENMKKLACLMGSGEVFGRPIGDSEVIFELAGRAREGSFFEIKPGGTVGETHDVSPMDAVQKYVDTYKNSSKSELKEAARVLVAAYSILASRVRQLPKYKDIANAGASLRNISW